jgi:PDZ domain-containing secreted protein
VLLNETYSTTSEEVAMQQTSALAEAMYRGGEFGVYVTHQHSTSDGEIPYLNVIIDVNDSNRRTYKVARQNSVYSSYARDILQKYSLTKEDLDRRFGNIN